MCHAGYAPRPVLELPRRPRRGPPPLPSGLWLSVAERDRLSDAVERIWREAVEAARDGARVGRLGIRREYDDQGRRLWAVRQDRDPYVAYATMPRAFMAFGPGRRMRLLLAFVGEVVAAARAAAETGEPGMPAGVVRLSR